MTKMKNVCPKCGSHLVLKDGQFGEFLACSRFPDCRYTQPCRDVDELYKPPSPYCSKCGHTGLLPFVKHGRIISNAFIDCECKSSIPEHYQSILPEDFDFSISYSFYRSLCQEYGWKDPGPDRIPLPLEEPKPQVIEHIVRTSNMSKKEFAQLQQTARKVGFFSKKLTEHLEFKKKPQPVKSSGKGIKIL